MRQSLIALASVSLTSRGEKVQKSLNSITILEILQTYFNVGTEKPKVNTTYNGLCPLQHMPLSSMSTKSMVALGNYLTHKKSIVEDTDNLSDKTQQFKPDYNLIQHVFDNSFETHKNRKLNNFIGCKLLAHHAEKYPQDENKYDLK